MIINRLVQSLGKRDWFMVVVEIVIVLVSVFIGIGVSNWNEDRQNRILAESHLERLASDLESEAIAGDDVLHTSAPAGNMPARRSRHFTPMRRHSTRPSHRYS